MRINLKKLGILVLAGIITVTSMGILSISATEEKETTVDEDEIRNQIADINAQITDLYAQLDELYALLPYDEFEGMFEISPEQQAIYDKIDAIHQDMQDTNADNVDLWIKLYGDETMSVNQDFDEIQFINASERLTDEEKQTLLEQISKEETSFAEIDELWIEYNLNNENQEFVTTDAENDNSLWNKVNALYNRTYAIKQKHFEIWDLIDYFIYQKQGEHGEDFNKEEYIKNISRLSPEEIEIALIDNNVIRIFEEQSDILINSLNAAETESVG